MNRYEEDYKIIEEAMENAYDLITGKITIDHLLEEGLQNKIYIAFNPDSMDSCMTNIDTVIKFFEENDEYEKCAELLEIKKEYV